MNAIFAITRYDDPSIWLEPPTFDEGEARALAAAAADEHREPVTVWAYDDDREAVTIWTARPKRIDPSV